MSGLYLVDQADWLRAAGLQVIEFDLWQERARSSGGYTGGRPWCVMWHHTASTASPANDANYCAEGSPDAPICNLIINRDGSATVIAAGATNTNGKGKALPFSRGTVPADSMNTHAVGMEIANGGTGEPYPQEQIDAAFPRASLAITGGLMLAPDDVAQHWDYAPDRKIDPATAGAVQGSWQPGAVNSSGTWYLHDLRVECARRAGVDPLPPVPPPIHPIPLPPTEDDMRVYCYTDDNGTIWVGNGIQRRNIPDMDVFNNYVALSSAGSGPLLVSGNGQVRQTQDVTRGSGALIEALGVVV